MSIPKGLRFEVLKRDRFCCQYCGAKAPEVLLHVDHVHPESAGGEATLLNLVAACESCNLGKGARLLSDDAAVSRQSEQMQRIADVREQMTMLLEWRAELSRLEDEQVDAVVGILRDGTDRIPDTSDIAKMRRWLRRFTVGEIVGAIDVALEQYVRERPAGDDVVDRILNVVPRIAAARRSPDYEIKRATAYAIGILRGRNFSSPWQAQDAIEDALHAGIEPEDVNDVCRNESSLRGVVWKLEGFTR
jgi:hypothetical protein